MKLFTEESGTTLYKIFEARNYIKSNKIRVFLIFSGSSPILKEQWNSIQIH